MKEPEIGKWEERKAMSLVNSLYELAELTVKQRQSINDKADEIVIEFIHSIESSALEEGRKIGYELGYKHGVDIQIYPKPEEYEEFGNKYK